MGHNSSGFEVVVVTNCLKINVCDPMKQKICPRIALMPPLCWVVTALVCPMWVWSQPQPNVSKPLVNFSGQIGVYTDLYRTSDSALSSKSIRRPPLMQRWSFDAKLGFRKISMPIKVNLGLPGGGFSMSRIVNPNLKQYLLMPGNGFGIQPTYKSFRLFLGTHTAKVSPLTAGNVPFVTGAGFQWNPWGILNLKASYGITQQAISRDSIHGVPGTYKREMLAAQVGVGKEKENHFYLSYVRAKDDTMPELIARSELPRRNAVDGTVVAMDIGAKLGRRMHLQSEAAVSAFTVNQLDTLPKSLLGSDARYLVERMAKLVSLTTSTRVGLAMDAKLNYRGRNWDWGIKGAVYSPGYQSLAFRNLQDDRLELNGDANFRMFKNRLTFHGAGGLKRNNLFEMQNESATQALLNANALLVLFRRLTLAMNYARFDMYVTPIDKHNLGLHQRSSNLGVNPSLSFGKEIVQVASINLSMDALMNWGDSSTGDFLANRALAWGLNHSVTLPNRLGAQLAINGFQNVGDSTDHRLWSMSLGLQHSLLEDRLKVSAQLQYTSTKGDPNGVGGQLALNGTVKYKFYKQLTTTLNLNLRLQNTQDELVDYQMIRHAINYNF